MTNRPPLQTRKIYSGKVIDLSVDTVKLPNGNTAELEIIRHPGGAAVVAVNRDNQVCLIRQYRYIIQDWLWELPAGKIDNNEDPQLTAIRELKEEAGISAHAWHSLGHFTSSPGVFGEIVHLYLAQDLVTGESMHEDEEVIEVHWVDFSLAKQWALDNTISDGKSALALLRAWQYLAENPV